MKPADLPAALATLRALPCKDWRQRQQKARAIARLERLERRRPRREESYTLPF
jgi:hypothetical protein